MKPNNDFRQHLRQELIQRCKRNPKYSLRAFAKQLDIDASTLSKLMNGKRPIGRKTVVQLGAKLGLSAEQVSSFTHPLSGDGGDSGSKSDLESFQQLALDQFAVISDWYHFAILELMTVDGFQTDSKWIAKALGIRTVEVDAAIDRLARIGMLEIDEKGDWADKSSGVTTNIGPDMVSSAHRRLQEQLLEKATQALAGVPLDDRDQTSVMMSIDRAKLPEAREKIKKFRRSLARYLNDNGDENKNDVYNLTISLFPLTQLSQRKLS